MMKIKDIIDHKDILGAIFYILERDYIVPWHTDASTLNQLYIANSGNKTISPYAELLLDDDEPKSLGLYSSIARLVHARCHENWEYLYKALFADYEPIENYNGTNIVVETEKGSVFDKRKGLDSGDKGIKSSTATDIKISTAQDTEVSAPASSEQKESAFNSSSYVPSSETIIGGGTNKTTTKGSAADNYQTTKGSAADNSTLTQDTHEEEREQTHSSDWEHKTVETKRGNQGVTTSQAMIQEEIALREVKFFDIVFKDIDKLIAISIY